MLIKLITPAMNERPMDSVYKRVMSPSLGLLTLASITPKEHQVILADENVSRLTLDDNPDLVGITVTVDTSVRAYEIADAYRKRNINVILGGIHVSAVPEEALQHATGVCIGDADALWPSIVKDAQNNRLKKIYSNASPPDISGTPPPDFGLIRTNKYLYTNIVYTSKNCPYLCDFCYNSMPYRKSYRNRDIDSVLREIRSRKTKHILFIDDNFAGNAAWTKKFLHRIKKENIKWSAAVTTDIIRDIKLIDLMREAGCQSLFIGFESINRESLQNVRKYQNLTEKYEELIHALHARGIMINASIVFGFDHDTPDVFSSTVEWLVRNRIESMTAHILTPYPGTKFYDKLLSEGRIVNFDHSKYNTANVVFKPRGMSAGQLYEGYLKAYKEFYSFKNIRRRIPESRKQIIPYLLFNICYRKYGKFFSKISRMGLMGITGKIARKLSYNIS